MSLLPPPADGRRTCSRAGCRALATTAIRWRNPRIHVDGRTKTWVACDGHVDFLRDFLADRSFPLEVGALDPVA